MERVTDPVFCSSAESPAQLAATEKAGLDHGVTLEVLTTATFSFHGLAICIVELLVFLRGMFKPTTISLMLYSLAVEQL